ncbi:MAG: hypothetical protein JNL90_20140 [Planctomycetes bacterium]|nr:hypothetical protein [Planctomycetota bacterium]
MQRDDDLTRSYQSNRGFRMWGGDRLPTGETRGLAWISLALVVGVALVLGTWVALRQ